METLIFVGCAFLSSLLQYVVADALAAATNSTFSNALRNSNSGVPLPTNFTSPANATLKKILVDPTRKAGSSYKYAKVVLPPLSPNNGLKNLTSANITSTPLKTEKVVTTVVPTNSSQNSSAPIDASEAGLSPVLFLFSMVLLIVAVMLVAKIVLTSKKRQLNGFGTNGFWTSRSSTQTSGGRLSLGGGPALGIPGGISLGGGSATYTAMPTNPTYRAPGINGTLCDPRLDWERQFFDNTDDDDEEHLTTNMEVEPHTGSKLELNLNK